MTKPELLANLATHINNSDWQSCTESFDGWERRLSNARPVSVVVPIFNGLDDVKKLLESKDLGNFASEVLLIDDHSPDPAIIATLKAAESEKEGIRVIRNPRNLGFVRTVNIGINQRQLNNDVVVLNSDTSPEGDWIERLQSVAYARPNVATVSPLSNSAGFFSLPKPNQVNAIPSELSPKECSQLLGWIAPSIYEETVATCGFCWYLRSDAIDRVGFLDEHLFHRGYAEETDFCLRASEQGLLNLCSLTTYVGHAGAHSFKGEKGLLKKNNANILKAIRPKFIEKLREYEQNSMLHELGNCFEMWLAKSSSGNCGKDTDSNFDPLDQNDLNVSSVNGRLVLSYSGSSEPLNCKDLDLKYLHFYLSARLYPKRICSQTPSGSGQDSSS